MEALGKALAEVLAVRDTEAARAVCLDVWVIAQGGGEAAGLALAAVVLDSARAVRERSPDPASGGAVLGEKGPPAGGCWWLGSEQLKTKLRAYTAWGESRPDWATHWAIDGSGWWKLPGG